MHEQNLEPAIRVESLHRTFGDLHAVQGVTFEVPRGQVVGFVGANGAGKTTTMRILATLDYPSAGSASVLGFDVVNFPGQVRGLLGWMPDSFGTYDHMTVVEYLDFFARALGFRGEERHRRVADVMEFTDLAPLADRLTNKLSKGMGQRLCLGRTLIHDPEVLILDEPAAGLDPKARVELKNLIRILAEDGKTILISSHILSELGEMCDSLLFIDNGKIVHHGDADSLRQDSGDETLVEVLVNGDTAGLLEWAVLAPHVGVEDERKAGARLRIDSADPGVVAGVLKRMVDAGLPVVEFHRVRRNLEDAFIHILGEVSRGNTNPVPGARPAGDAAPPPVSAPGEAALPGGEPLPRPPE